VTLTDCVVVFPATSVACTEIVLEPVVSATAQLYEPLCTVAAVPLQVTDATPERASETLPDTDAGEEVSTAPFVGDAMLKAGGVLSMFSVTLAVLVSPFVSVTVPVTT
jgi:hypothetical protein